MNTIILLIIAIILINIGFTYSKLCISDDIFTILLYIGIFSLICALIYKRKSLIKIDKNIIIASLTLFMGYALFIYLVQNNDISRITIYGNICGILFISLIGYYYFKEQLTPTNIIGIALMCLGIYLLSIKKNITNK